MCSRLRDIAASLGISERSAHGIVTDLAEAGYVLKQKDGRRNRYQIQAHLPLPEPGTREPAVGEVLALLLGSKEGLTGQANLAAADRIGDGPADGADAITARGEGHGVPGREDGDRPCADRPESDLLPGDHDRARTAGRMGEKAPRSARLRSASDTTSSQLMS